MQRSRRFLAVPALLLAVGAAVVGLAGTAGAGTAPSALPDPLCSITAVLTGPCPSASTNASPSPAAPVTAAVPGAAAAAVPASGPELCLPAALVSALQLPASTPTCLAVEPTGSVVPAGSLCLSPTVITNALNSLLSVLGSQVTSQLNQALAPLTANELCLEPAPATPTPAPSTAAAQGGGAASVAVPVAQVVAPSGGVATGGGPRGGSDVAAVGLGVAVLAAGGIAGGVVARRRRA